MDIWTIGHSTRSIDELLAVLQGQSIRLLADVRRYPASRRHPHFSQPVFAEALRKCGIDYLHFPELGGRRAARADSTNTAWRVEAFRGYADYMMTDPFRAGIERLLAIAVEKRVALLCAEALWWRCHRALIADHLKAAGHTVLHILSGDKTELHPFTSAAQIRNGKLSYQAGSETSPESLDSLQTQISP
jgi:uncharacterized protein (DUF488 family)